MKIRSIVGQLSGSLGGQTASHNKGGPYLRMRSIPTNPNSVRQQAVRTAMAGLVQAWTEVLTASQREAWGIYAANVPVTDSLGETITLTGQNWYIGNNTPRIQAGASRVDDAPNVFDQGVMVAGIALSNTTTPGEIGVLSGSMSTDIELEGAAPGAGVLLIYLGAPQNPSINYFKGPYQLADTIAISMSDTSKSWSTPIASLLNGNGDPIDGQYRGIKMRISYSDGRLSPVFSRLSNVADDPI